MTTARTRVRPGTGRTGGEPLGGSAYRARVKWSLSIAALAAVAALIGAVGAATAGGRGVCVVPRLYALTPRVAEARLTAAGCTLGGVAHERPPARTALVAGQVPAPGAVLPRRTAVALLVS